jgi:hypothetical protein
MMTSDEIQEHILRLEQQIGAAIAGMRRQRRSQKTSRSSRSLASAVTSRSMMPRSRSMRHARTIKRKINSGEFTLEQIPGTRVFGIPASQIFDKWTPATIAKKAAERQRKATR